MADSERVLSKLEVDMDSPHIILPSGFVVDRSAAVHVMEPMHTRGVTSFRGFEAIPTLVPPKFPDGAELSFDTDGFVADLSVALDNNTAGYVMQLRQHGQPIASNQVNWAKRPPAG